jgi:DNA-binding response OmpR family regulator
MRILVVEDDPAISSFLVRGLTEEGFVVDLSADGEDGMFKAVDPAYDLIVLDLMLPKVNGLNILQEVRAHGLTVPVLVLTARDAVSDRIRGLDAGADDYLVKPFSFDELLARIRALLRRTRRRFDTILRVANLSLDRLRREARTDEHVLDLSMREFAVLEYFMEHPEEVLSRTRIYEHVWNEQMALMSNVIDVYVKELRRRLAQAGARVAITTIRGVGYRLEEQTS